MPTSAPCVGGRYAWTVRSRLPAAITAFMLGVACAGDGTAPSSATGPRHGASPAPHRADLRTVAHTAQAMVGAPYRTGGSTPRGFDCSGLVVYSYARAGVPGLPHSARVLERRTRPIRISELQLGDLLFFRLDGKKTTHVGIYVGDRAFVHAPSRGKQVERVSFDHVYWGPRLKRAGRIE